MFAAPAGPRTLHTFVVKIALVSTSLAVLIRSFASLHREDVNVTGIEEQADRRRAASISARLPGAG